MPPIQLPARAPKPDQAFSGRPAENATYDATQPITIPTAPIVRTIAPRHATFIDWRMLMSSSISTMNSGTAKDLKVV